jgi:NADH-quinone oxidoreductase subunit M
VPVYAGILIFFSMASLGLPGLSGFVSEFLVLLGGYQYGKLFAGLACIGIILAAAYLLYMIRRVLMGPLNPRWDKLTEIDRREVATLVPLIILTVAFGVYPKWILDYMAPTLAAILQMMTGGAA